MAIRLDELMNNNTVQEEKPTAIRLDDLLSSQHADVSESAPEGFFDVDIEKKKQFINKGPIGFFEQWGRIDKTEMLPWWGAGESAVKHVSMINAVNRYRTNDYKDDSLKEQDIQNIKNYIEKTTEETIRGMSIPGQILTGVAHLPAFMIEFVSTGGASALAKVGIKKAAVESIKKGTSSALKKTIARQAGAVAGAAGRTAAMPQRIADFAAQSQLQSNFELTEKGVQMREEAGESIATSVFKGIGDTMIEAYSETSGAFINKIGGRFVPKKLTNAMEKVFRRLKPNRVVKDLWTKAGYNGFLAEMGEERLGALLRAVTGIEDFGADDPDSMLDRIIASIPNGEELLVEAGVLAFPGAARLATSKAIETIQNNRKEAPQDTLNELTDKQVDDIIATEVVLDTSGTAPEAETLPLETLVSPTAQKVVGVEEKKDDQAKGIQEIAPQPEAEKTTPEQELDKVVSEESKAKKQPREKARKLNLSERSVLKRLFQGRFKGERIGFREGKKAAKSEIKSAKEILDRRRSRVKRIRDLFNLTDSELKSITRKDIRLMNNYEFKQHINLMEAKAAELEQKREIKAQILFTIQDLELKKVDNLRNFMKLPSLNNMSVKQLNEFNQELDNFQKGDEFLSLRKLETVKNTELAGIRTVREAKEKLAKKLGVPLSSVENLPVSPLDKFLFDTALAKRNPFYRFLIDETNASLLDGEQRFFEMEREVDELTKKARKSRKRGLVEKAIPSDKLVFDWLNSKPAQKQVIAEKMTSEEIDLANYLQSRFAQFRDYLIQHSVLERYQSNYITHIRRGFLETWKEDGLLNAFKEVFKQYQEDEAVFKILEDDTQNILPLEKFFQFSMRRSGVIKPSQNVAKAFKAYTRAMLKKQSLDKIVPALDIYAYSLSPKGLTPRGLEMDRRLIKFVREWINNKKGRKSSLGGLLPQNGVVDVGMRLIDSFITLIDLGLNLPVGVTVNIGEQVTTFVNLGSKQYAKGLARMQTKKGKKVIKDNESFIGKSIWRDLSDTANTIGDTFNKGMFALFDISNVNANSIHLLGSMTDAEWDAGEISSERKAQLKRDIGRFRNVAGAKSIFGATSLGSALTKYKTWALPILNTIISDIDTVSHMVAKGEFSEVIKTREFNELFRATLTTSLLVLAGHNLVDDDDDSFLGQVVQKAYRESLTILGGIDPTVLSAVRMLKFLQDLSIALKQIVLLETYKRKSGFKGVNKLKSTITPKALKQIIPRESTSAPSI